MRALTWPDMSWSIFDDLYGLRDEISRGVGAGAPERFPPVDAWVNDEKIVLEFELPGIAPEKLDVSVKGDTISLSGERTPDELQDSDAYHRQERLYGSFRRTLQLPFRVEGDKVDACYEKGILRVTLARCEADKPRRIEIKAE